MVKLRKLFTLPVLVLVGALQACGGGGGGGATPPLTPTTGQGPTVQSPTLATPTAAPTATPLPLSPVTPPPVATPTPLPQSTAAPSLPSFNAPPHVLTADYLGRPDGTSAISWSQAATYLSWAQTGINDGAAISAAGIKTQFYVDAARTQTNDALYTTDESTFAHDCSGNRITDDYHGTTQYVMNVASPDYANLFASRVRYASSYAHFDAVFSDDSGPLSVYQEEHPFAPSLPCSYSDAAWLASDITFQQASPVPVLFNGLHEVDLTTHAVSPSIGLLQSTNALGGNFEECYGSASHPKEGGWFWKTTEQTELQVAQQHKLFECMVEDSSSAAASTDARLYTYASFLLTYDPQSSIIWDFYQTGSGFHVEPESQLVALNPLISSVTDVSALQKSGGSYGREYASCYLAGQSVGPCAVVVNPTSAPVSFPYAGYHHSLLLSGGGIVDGGTAAASGPAPSGTLNAYSAAVVFQ